jgi:hypothetical protein
MVFLCLHKESLKFILHLYILGKVTVYVGKRDFIDHLDFIDPIDGVVVVENDYLQGRKVFGMV